MTRAFAVLLFLAGIGLVAFGAFGVMQASERGRFVATVGAAFDAQIDAVDWANHWRVTSVEMTIVGCLIGVAAIGLWQGRPGASLLFVLTVVGQLSVDMAQHFAHYSRYAFEAPDPVRVALYLIAAIGGMVGFIRMRMRQRRLAAGT